MVYRACELCSQKKKKKSNNRQLYLSLLDLLVIEWPKGLHAAICTVVEVYRIASASVNECEGAVDWI